MAINVSFAGAMLFPPGAGYMHVDREVFVVNQEQMDMLKALDKLGFIEDLRLPFTSDPDGKNRVSYRKIYE